jgi:hypothetical protein
LNSKARKSTWMSRIWWYVYLWAKGQRWGSNSNWGMHHETKILSTH